MFEMEWIPDIEKEMEAAGYGWFSLDNLPDDMIHDLKRFFETESRIVENLIRHFRNG